MSNLKRLVDLFTDLNVYEYFYYPLRIFITFLRFSLVHNVAETGFD